MGYVRASYSSFVFVAILGVFLFLMAQSSVAKATNGTEVGNGMVAEPFSELSFLDDQAGESSILWTCFSRYDAKSDSAPSYASEPMSSREEASYRAIEMCSDAHDGSGDGCLSDGCTFTSENQ